MKTIFRILVILIAAAIVGSIIFVLVGNNTSNTRFGLGRRGGAEFHPGDNAEFRPHDDSGSGPERGSEEFGGDFFFPEGVIKGLLAVSVVMIVWLNAGRLFVRRKAIQAK